MARKNGLIARRGTRAELNASVAASTLMAGELLFITDENRIAVGTAVNNAESMAKLSEVNAKFSLIGGNITGPTTFSAAATVTFGAGVTFSGNIASNAVLSANGGLSVGTLNSGLTTSLITLQSPGVGITSGFNINRASDSAGIAVTELAVDTTLYEFWLSDNPDGANDRFQWRYTDHQGSGGLHVPLEIAGTSYSRYINTQHQFYGRLVQQVGAFFTTNVLNPTYAAGGNVITINTIANLPMSTLTGTAAITALNIAGFTGSNGAVVWIRATGASTFEWGYGATNTAAVQTGLPIQATATTLSNGITVTFNSSTGGGVGDRWQFRAWTAAAANTLGPTTVSGTMTATTFSGSGASLTNIPASAITGLSTTYATKTELTQSQLYAKATFSTQTVPAGVNLVRLNTVGNPSYRYDANAATYAALIPGAIITDAAGRGFILDELVLTPEHFEATGDGTTNDTLAFQRLSAFINWRGSGIVSFRPGRTYIVGKQSTTLGAGPAYVEEQNFSVDGVKGLTVMGNGAIIKNDASLHYGSFNPATGLRHDAPAGGFSNTAYRAAIGHIFNVINSTHISISDLTIDGNSDNIIVGGYYGDKGYQLPGDALRITYSDFVRADNLKLLNSAHDGLYLNLLGNVVGGVGQEMLGTFHGENILCDRSGRQGCSITGGSGFTFKNCRFNRSGQGIIKSPPMAGCDIEPAGRWASDVRFEQCQFVANGGVQAICDSGVSVRGKFDRCIFWGGFGVSAELPVAGGHALLIEKSGYVFEDCEIHGSSSTLNDDTIFRNCTWDLGIHPVYGQSGLNSTYMLATGGGKFFNSTLDTSLTDKGISLGDQSMTSCKLIVSGNTGSVPGNLGNGTFTDCDFIAVAPATGSNSRPQFGTGGSSKKAIFRGTNRVVGNVRVINFTTGVIPANDEPDNIYNVWRASTATGTDNSRFTEEFRATVPISGFYRAGSIVHNSSNAAGNATRWVCTVTGAIGTVAWAPSTAYLIDDVVYNGATTYVVTGSGISAASGGPTGNGSSITDGTVTWRMYPPFIFSPLEFDVPGVTIVPAGTSALAVTPASTNTIRWSAAYTANRTATIAAAGAIPGRRYRFERMTTATGAFTLSIVDGVSATTIKTLNIGDWVDVEFDGTNWVPVGGSGAASGGGGSDPALAATVDGHTTQINGLTTTVNGHTTTIDGHTSTINGHTTQLASLSGAVAAIVPSGGDYQGAVATTSMIPTTLNAGAQQMMTRTAHYATDEIKLAKLVFPNFIMTNRVETAIGSTTADIRASIEYPLGTFTQVLFGGQVTGVAANKSLLTSDGTVVNIPVGAKFWVRTWYYNTSGIAYSTNPNFGNQLANGATTPDYTMGGTIAALTVAGYGPVAIVGTTKKPTVFIAGDSIFAGQGDTPDDALTRGPIARSLVGIGHINAGVPGDTANNVVVAGNYALRGSLAQYCSHVITGYGFNDIFQGAGAGGGRTAAQVLADHQTFYALPFFTNKLLFQTTITAKTTSTDAWVTEANQTVSPSLPIRTTVNSTLRGGVNGLRGIIELAATIESKTTPGIWAVEDGAALTGDGTHFTRRGNLIVQRARPIPTLI